MCLYVSKKLNATRPKFNKIKVYKVLRKNKDEGGEFLSSPIKSYHLWAPGINTSSLKKRYSREYKQFKNGERTQLDKGIHCYTTLEAARGWVKDVTWLNKGKNPYVIVEVTGDYRHFISYGKHSHILFTQVHLSKEEYEKALWVNKGVVLKSNKLDRL